MLSQQLHTLRAEVWCRKTGGSRFMMWSKAPSTDLDMKMTASTMKMATEMAMRYKSEEMESLIALSTELAAM
jgi:hypothetical protein